MENLAFPLFVSMFWTSVSCIFLRFYYHGPYNYLCAVWITLSFAGVILVDALFYLVSWPLNFFTSAILLPCGIIFYTFNLKKFVDEIAEEPRWGRYIFGATLVTSASILAFQKIFFGEMIKQVGSHLSFEQALYLYVSMVLTIS